MGSITTNIDIHNNLTIITANGILLYEDIMSTVTDYYSGTVTEFILWDLSEADVSKISNDEIMKIATKVKNISTDRVRGKTAIVSPKDLGYGLARMFEVFSEIQNLPFAYKSFRNISEAKNWLGI